MSLFNTAEHYDVIIDIPYNLNFSWNYIYDDTVFNLEEYIATLSIKNQQSLIVLWGADRRINVNDIRFKLLNDFYHSVPNPMILFNGSIYGSPGVLNFPYKELDFFSYLSKVSAKRVSYNQFKSKKFFYASSKDYLSRRYILASLIKHNLHLEGYLSYKCMVSNHDFEQYDFTHLSIIKEACNSIDHLVPIRGFDDYVEYKRLAPFIAENSYLSIITDTYPTKPLFFSEKIFNAMLYNHFFIYFGPPGSLRLLKSKGFKTWGHILDESYDDIENTAERLFAVSDTITQFLNQPIEKIRQLYIENAEIINHNRNLVLSCDINNTIVSSMQNAISLKNSI